MLDWRDRIAADYAAGRTHCLTPDQHEAVNSRHPGATLERCSLCDEFTGRAGRGEDSIYLEDDTGPFCEECSDGLKNDPRHPDFEGGE